MKCPACGSKLFKLKSGGRYECRNKGCPVIEVRKGRRGLRILYDSTSDGGGLKAHALKQEPGKPVKPRVRWDGLIETFNVEGEGEYKVVRVAEGVAPWGSTIRAELFESEFGVDVLVLLPEQGDLLLAVLDGREWEIWVTPKGGIHVSHIDPHMRYPPGEYLILTGNLLRR